jgi:hypothetical protein
MILMYKMGCVILFFCLLGVYPAFAQDDSIPGNCPYEQGVYYQAILFPRYEPQNQRIVLADWSTGADVRELATGISAQEIEMGRWSPECQYFSASVGIQDEHGVMLWDTYVWDTVNGEQIALFEDARLIPYPLTWDTNSTQILVETRSGGYLWKLNGAHVWLTSEADYNARIFRPGTVEWDYATNQIRGVLSISPFGSAAYDMNTGKLLALTDQSGKPLDPNAPGLFDMQANTSGDAYPCRTSAYGGSYLDGARVLYQPQNHRIVMQDENTRELIRVLEENIDTYYYGGESWLPGCHYMVYQLGRYGDADTIFYDMETGTRTLVIEDRLIRQSNFDPSGTYAVITTRLGASLYHIPTGRRSVLIPNVMISPYGSGRVWAYDRVEWDLANNQVRLLSRQSNWTNNIVETRIFDLNTGSLLNVLDWNNESLNNDDTQAISEQIAAPYGCRFMVRYQTYNNRVVLQDPVTGELIAVVEDNLTLNGFRLLGKSPDCRYIAAALGTEEDMDTVVWDLSTLQRAGVFENAVEIPHGLNWSPYGGYVVVSTRNGGYLWYLPTDTRILLNPEDENEYHRYYSGGYATVRSFHYLEWDMERGQVLAVPVGRDNTVIAYDLATGQPVAEYGTGNRVGPVNFLQLDGTGLLVYTSADTRVEDDPANGLALWNRDTGTGIQLAMNFYPAPYYGGPRRHANPQFSLDGSRMMMRSSNYVYIWDLTALAGSEPYLPNHVYQVPDTRTFQFIDNDTFEVTTFTSTRYQLARRLYTITTYRYDVNSGALLSETPEEFHFDYYDLISLSY